MLVAPQVSYPGVYIQEVPSDVRTITPVETATTAFIGRALRGPVNKPVICNSYADFERVFGGLWLESKLGYAVNHFFSNGGSKAVIVRLFTAREAVVAASEMLDAVKAAKNQADIEEAAKDKAKNFKDKPGERGAKVVLQVIESRKNASVQSIKEAIKKAIDAFATSPDLARLPVNGAFKHALAAAETVFEAAEDAAGVKEPKPTAKSVKEAAQKAAEQFTEKGPAKQAALAVQKAIEAIPDNVNDLGGALKNIEPGSVAEEVTKEIPSITMIAKYPGAWGNNLCVRITDVDEKVREQLAQQYRVKEEDLFNLIVHDRETGATETFPNVTVVAGPRRLDKVLENKSEMIVVDGELPSMRPFAHPDPRPGKGVWDDPYARDAVAEEGQATDGDELTAADFQASEEKKEGIYALEHTNIFNLLCIPPYQEGDEDVAPGVLADAAAYCEKRRALLLVDPPKSWIGKDKARDGFPIPELSSNNAAVFFPRIQAPNLLRDNQVEDFAPSGAIAGVMARTDATRGVWKAAAGQEATLRGVVGLSVPLTDAENGELNPLGINCLRQMPAAGYVVWGARTTVGDDRLASQWKYIPVRRTALFIEESLYRSTQWAVFEPNDEPLWSQLRLNIGVFMHGLFRQGAFQGQSPKDAYFVKCDSTTTTQADIDRGIVNIIVGFAPLKPAEFVVLYIKQMAGQPAV
jgi:phage tail sheath protein FI